MVMFGCPRDVSVGESTYQPPHPSPVSSSPHAASDPLGRFWELIQVLSTTRLGAGF